MFIHLKRRIEIGVELAMTLIGYLETKRLKYYACKWLSAEAGPKMSVDYYQVMTKLWTYYCIMSRMWITKQRLDARL